jgi:UPF0755 protein
VNKKLFFVVPIIVLVIAIFGYSFYQKIYGSSVTKTSSVYIYSNDSFEILQKKIKPLLKDIDDFNWVANKKSFKTPKAGYYLLKEGMSNDEVVNLLRIGAQTPIKVSFNNQNTLSQFVARISEQIEADSLALYNAFTDTNFLDKNKLTKKTVLQICLPNTYEFYWTTSPENFRNKLLNYYNKFWNGNRLAKAKQLNLTKTEVITLASIVQKETAKREERPRVAGLYLNRLKKGWPLQADPTIIYTLKEKNGQNFVVKRVLTKDLSIVSPYNTYLNAGLPPSLIAMADISSIDAVLNAEKHNYYFMCANVENIGYHKFAKTLSQHNRNANQYRRWLNKLGVNR